MTEIRRLAPHDPLPEGHSVIVMRRFDEDAPRSLMIEMIVTNPDHSEETSRVQMPDGTPMTLNEATELGMQRAAAEGLDIVWQLDRTQGSREQEILRHGGDHGVDSAKLDDDDLEDGVRGSDMRDRGNDGGPRRF